MYIHFALKPEEHQPSGTLNMSRIDTAQLKLSFSASAWRGQNLRSLLQRPPYPQRYGWSCVF